MPKDIVIDMPTDMRNTEGHFSTFDLDYTPLKPGGITSLTIDIPTSSRIPNEPRPPPRWKTPEFIFYYVVALFAIPLMVWVPIHLSSRMWVLLQKIATSANETSSASHPNYPYYRHKLSSGWMFGREVVSVISCRRDAPGVFHLLICANKTSESPNNSLTFVLAG